MRRSEAPRAPAQEPFAPLLIYRRKKSHANPSVRRDWDECLFMPYRVNTDLPPRVRNHLPEQAQDIYRETFNHAYAAHAGDMEREKRAHMIAWAAVKRSYVKADDHWAPR
jgi:cation transport regulator